MTGDQTTLVHSPNRSTSSALSRMEPTRPHSSDREAYPGVQGTETQGSPSRAHGSSREVGPWRQGTETQGSSPRAQDSSREVGPWRQGTETQGSSPRAQDSSREVGPWRQGTEAQGSSPRAHDSSREAGPWRQGTETQGSPPRAQDSSREVGPWRQGTETPGSSPRAQGSGRRSGSSFLIDNLLGAGSEVTTQGSNPGKSKLSLGPLPCTRTHPYYMTNTARCLRDPPLFPQTYQSFPSLCGHRSPLSIAVNTGPASDLSSRRHVSPAPSSTSTLLTSQSQSNNSSSGVHDVEGHGHVKRDPIDPTENVAVDDEDENGEDENNVNSVDSAVIRHKKKTRTVFSRAQIFYLETAFEAKRYLSSTERADLAATLRLSETQVKVWFQNRRNKWKSQLSGDPKYSDQGPPVVFPPVPFPEGFSRHGFSPLALSALYRHPMVYF